MYLLSIVSFVVIAGVTSAISSFVCACLGLDQVSAYVVTFGAICAMTWRLWPFILRRKVIVKSYTLIEMLVVIMIFLVLAGMSYGVIKKLYRKADATRDKHRLEVIISNLNAYHKEFGYYPYYGCVVKMNDDDDLNGTPDFFEYWEKGHDELWTNRSGCSGIVDSNKNTYFYLYPGRVNREMYDLWGVGGDEDHGNDDDGIELNNDPGSAGATGSDDIKNW